MKEYALYKGDELLAFGTIPFIANQMGVTRDTIKHYKTQTYKRRMKKRKTQDDNIRTLICIDDYEDDEVSQ